MSMHLDFEPHSWYMGFAIRDCRQEAGIDSEYSEKLGAARMPWEAYTDDGNVYQIIELEADTLADLKAQIIAYHLNKRNGYGERIAKRRLEYLRGELREERISYDELAELQSLLPYIERYDIELLEAIGTPEVTS